MADKQDYLKRLQLAIQDLYQCKATYRRTVTVHEVLEGNKAWNGDVEIFWLNGHPGAKRCFAWSQQEGPSQEHIVAILEKPPVIGPATAVRALLTGNQGPHG